MCTVVAFTALLSRSARCTTSTLTTRFPTISTAICRTMETCEVPACPSTRKKPDGITAWVVKYRCHWTPPLAIDPFDHNTVYYGCQVIFRTTNAGQSWSVVSPDLSTRNPAHLVP